MDRLCVQLVSYTIITKQIHSHTCKLPPVLHRRRGCTSAFHSGQTQKAFQSLEVWISSKVYEREVRMKTMQNMSRQTEFHGQQNLCRTVTSFPTHTQRRKLKFSKTTLSFAVKVKLSTFVCIFLCKIIAGIAHAFDRCEPRRRMRSHVLYNISLVQINSCME